MSRTTLPMRPLNRQFAAPRCHRAGFSVFSPQTPRPGSRLGMAGLLLAGCCLGGLPSALSPALPLAFTSAAQLQEADPVEEGQAKEERGEKCLVHLTDGRVLRVRARAGASGSPSDLGEAPEKPASWQIRQGREWITLPGSMIKRVALERDVLKTARKLAKELETNSKRSQAGRAGIDLGRNVAYASWLVDEGLLSEAAQELDSVLRQDPDQPQALALLAQQPIPIDLPQLDTSPGNLERSLERFLGAASRSNVLGGEIALQHLAQRVDQIPDLEEALVVALHKNTTRQRRFAAHALRRLFPGEEVRPLLRRAILDSSGDVRREASLALRDVGDEAVLAPAVRALGSKQSIVRENAVQAMAVMNYRAAVEPLVHHLGSLQSGSSGRQPHSNIFVGRQFAYVQDFDVEVAQGSSIADPIINVLAEGAVLDAAVISSSTSRTQSELVSTRRALTQLTGQNPGNSVKAWQDWWDKNGDAWRSGTSSGPRSAPVSPDR